MYTKVMRVRLGNAKTAKERIIAIKPINTSETRNQSGKTLVDTPTMTLIIPLMINPTDIK